MKRKTFLAGLLLAVAGLQTAWAQGVKVWQNGKAVYYELGSVDSIAFDERNIINGHEWVDLGLPSGTLWATCNIGAESPEEFGSYFAWGETKPKKSFYWSNYRYYTKEYLEPDDYEYYDVKITKYCNRSDQGYNGFTDGLLELLPEDDAATANWGDEWQMPSKEQCEELLNSEYTTIVWSTLNNIEGTTITSKVNGNSIFLPYAGFYFEGDDYEWPDSPCWSRSLDQNNWYAVSFCGDVGSWLMDRHYGLTVRPVRKQ